ncbi:relaxase/mobilization nuclease domain-containing protein [Micromonospora sp. RL09-050-HVF-A]|uniref:relaxase/mobilization nuclease domain-containing protein n=1 Tax=Micromonospora sp. RL09-050-HVF-A TaxID=1703433 RepID=UPI001C5D16F2|nr:relaxase [Micromonospora sp. RL09-050-HVF-A]MBW4700325.1 relaxase [Micromonospora sp. RL09-050-HVF-A]
MIPKVTYGTDVDGLLRYLFGPGKAEEHVNPHLVAGYDDVALLAPKQRDGGGKWSLGELGARLKAPQIAAGERGVQQYVWQCSLSLPAQEGQLDDATWGRIAGRFVAEMGFTGDAERAGCRWVAVRHGLSANGNDHVHLVVTLATEDGAPVWLRQDKRRSQQVADLLEDEFGLGKWTPGRAGATKRPELSRPEVDRARRSGQAPDRELLRRQVRAALAGADSEADWVGRMKGAGLLVAARTAAEDPNQVVGYAVALRPAGVGKPTWYAGRSLDGDLSLPQVRKRWPEAQRPSAEQWKAADSAESRLRSEDRMAVWRSSAAVLEDVAGRLAGVAPGSPKWPAVARASAELLARVAAATEPSGRGPVSRAADALARAAAPPRRAPAPASSSVARELGRVADALLVAGHARDGGEAAVLLAVVVQAARLVVALAELRAAEQQAHAAGAAAAAAAHLMPLLQSSAPPVDQVRVPTQNGLPQRPAHTVPGPVRPRVDPSVDRDSR